MLMENCSIDEDVRFFDAREDISDLVSDGSGDYSSSFRVTECELDSLDYEFWTKSPSDSVHERRHKFVSWMGLGLDENLSAKEESEDVSCDIINMGIERLTENSGAVLRSSTFEESNNALELVENGGLGDNFLNEVKNLDYGAVLVNDAPGQNGLLSKLREVGSNRSVTVESFHKSFGSSHLVQQLLQKQVDEAKKLRIAKKKVKKSWLQRLGLGDAGCIGVGKREVGLEYTDQCDNDYTVRAMYQKIRVHPHKKRSKELSSLFAGQDFSAHEGSILTMKFSLNGKYLATGGEDCIVRVWKVTEVERSNEFDIANIDHLNVYYSMNHGKNLAPLDVDKQTSHRVKIVRKSSDSACVVFPPKVFRLSEKPLHEFQGHSGEVLDLSWSKKKYLLSSSVDKTARLWKVGCDQCLRVYSHNNYVTCIGFNPVDDNYFISGSIDGKVRIWEVLSCRVVDWIDIREIVTAVCYRPDGKGGIVGSMTGNCRLYDIIDDHLELDAEICLQGKKKLQGKKITGFQFSPNDLTKVMVTSADSVVRILCGANVICKYKGIRKSGSHLSASFTSDGKHIVSSSEESNVHVWNYTSQDKTTTSKPKKISSSESFLSQNSSIVLPWCGMNNPTLSALPSPTYNDNDSLHNEKPFCGHLLESLLKGTATWPEEKLPNSPALCKSQYALLKSACYSMSSAPHLWGLVIVTAGRDGRIRTYQNYGVPIRL